MAGAKDPRQEAYERERSRVLCDPESVEELEGHVWGLPGRFAQIAAQSLYEKSFISDGVWDAACATILDPGISRTCAWSERYEEMLRRWTWSDAPPIVTDPSADSPTARLERWLAGASIFRVAERSSGGRKTRELDLHAPWNPLGCRPAQKVKITLRHELDALRESAPYQRFRHEILAAAVREEAIDDDDINRYLGYAEIIANRAVAEDRQSGVASVPDFYERVAFRTSGGRAPLNMESQEIPESVARSAAEIVNQAFTRGGISPSRGGISLTQAGRIVSGPAELREYVDPHVVEAARVVAGLTGEYAGPPRLGVR